MATLGEQIRVRLFLDYPFFGSLAMRLQLEETTAVPTLSTNGTRLRYNKEFLKGLSNAEQVGVFAHEVEHCALLHPYRRNGRDLEEWNNACDYAINDMLVTAGLSLPKGVLLDKKYAGMSAEEIYSKRKAEQTAQPQNQQGQGQPQQGSGKADQGQGPSGTSSGQQMQPGAGKSTEKPSGKLPTGDFEDGATEEEGPGEAAAMTAHDWMIAAEQAAKVCQAAGTMPAGMGVAFGKSREPMFDYVTEMRDFVVHTVASDQAWTSPNRRFVGQGIYLPGTIKENTGRLVVYVDTSGSCVSITSQFASTLAGILSECRPELVTVIYGDAAVQGVEEYGPDDFDVIPKPKGGGGTRFVPIFERIEQDDMDPVAMICLTDLESCDKPVEPAFPVLWVAPLWATRCDAPFGRKIYMVEDK